MATEIEQIIKHIKDGHHFLLSGGAGSGKTYTLIQVIRWLIEEYPTALIACVTYTNAAVREIENRVNHDNLRVSTIQTFCGTASVIFKTNCEKPYWSHKK